MRKKKKFYIATPIYYINDRCHIGHAYTTVMADIIARWHRLKGEDVFFLTGTDENSQKTVQAAKKLAFSSTEKFADYMAEEWKKAWNVLNISNTDFIRTTEERHKNLVVEFIKKVWKNKDIYKGMYKGLYCDDCEAFLNQNELINGLCQYHKKPPKEIEEENYFFKLSKYQDKILKLLIENKEFVQPESRRNEMINFAKELKDISITRENAAWGIDFPIDQKHKLYVWSEALLNYLQPKEYWPSDIQLMAKDIVKFHAIIFSALLMSAGYKLPKKIFAHGFFTVNGEKMSKTLGNVIDPIFIANKYGVDALRYFYAREIPFGQDGDFSEVSLKTRLNNELANELGNLLSRTLTLIEKNLNSEIKKDKTDKKLFKILDIKRLDDFMENLEPHNAIAGIFGFVHECNAYINQKEPWKINNKKELNYILYNLADALRIIAILIFPFMPLSSEKINLQLNIKLGNLKDCKPGLLKEIKIKKGEILFKKIE